jgi:hypothetical protein
MPQSQVGVYLPVSEVFPNIRSDFQTFKSLLQNLSRADTLFWCSRLNLIVSDSSDIDHIAKQQFGTNQFFTSEEIIAINDFAKRHGGAQNFTVFFRGQLLELLRWVTLYCHDHPGDGTTFEDAEVRRRFAQAALLASDIWARRVFKDRFSLDGGIEIARRRALGPSRKSIEATSSTPNLSKSLGRGWYLVNDYFPRHYPRFEEEFRASTDLSVEEYYICLAAVMANFIDPKRGTGIFRSDLHGESMSYRDALQKYVVLDSQTPDELQEALWGSVNRDINNDEDAPPYDYRPLRERPILRTNDGRAIILDPVFYSDRATVGPMFLLAKQQSQDKANEIFGAFGKAFEDYACDILQRMFPDISSVATKRLSCRISKADLAGNEIEMDACLNDVVEAVIFEIKAVWIREGEILTDDHERYLEHLREKYIATEGVSRNRRSKGISQLARVANLLASQEWLEQNREFIEAKLVYPILLVYDPLLTAPVYGHFLASEFKALLAPDDELPFGNLKKGQLQVAPLIVMTVDDLENLETSIEHFGFRDLLAEYSRTCSDRLTSLHDFIALSKYSQQIYHSCTLVARGMEILDKSRKAIFPMEGETADSGSQAA